jgi:gas vesicle protein
MMMEGLLRGLGRFLLGLIIGAIIGAVLSTLFAPTSGDELKRLIAQRLRDAAAAGERAQRETERELHASFRRRMEQNGSDSTMNRAERASGQS